MIGSLSQKSPPTQRGIEPKSTPFKKTTATQQVLWGIKPKSTDRSLSKKSPATQQLLRGIEPKSKVVLTHEQARVASHSIRDGEVLKVVALAGKQCTACALSAPKTCMF